jgi:DNA-directed RNA polymerase specialized sigma24 family protein
MLVSMGLTLMDDATLVSRAVGGDRDAFADIYDRYAGAVFDLCTAILRHPEEAADATLDSFLRAARELVNLQDRSRLRPWLLAVARHEATVRAERPGAEGRRAPTEAGEVQEWDPAEALSEGDRAVLHLHLRHQLEGEELGAVVGMRPAVAEARAARLRTMAETSVGALLLSRTDSAGDASACAGLGQVLDGWDGRFNPSIGVRINRHAKGCAACQSRRTMLLDRLQAMATLPFAAPPPWMRPEVLMRMELAVSSRTLPGWGEDGFPPGIGSGGGRGGAGRSPRSSRSRPRRSVVLAGAAAVVVLAVAGVLLVTHDWDGASTVSASLTPTTRAPESTVVAPPTTVRAPVTTAVTPTTAVTATTGPAAPGPTAVPVPTTTPTPAPAPPPAPSPEADRDPPAIAFVADAATAYVYGCPYSRTGVSADVSDQSEVVWVALFVRRPDGVDESLNMSFDGGRWRGTMGDFDTPGQAVFWVEAIDSEGNRAQAPSQILDVFLCPGE